MNKRDLIKLYRLMLKANKHAEEGRLIEQDIQEMEKNVFGEELADKITSTDEWTDSMVGDYSNAEFEYPNFDSFETKVKEIVDEITEDEE